MWPRAGAVCPHVCAAGALRRDLRACAPVRSGRLRGAAQGAPGRSDDANDAPARRRQRHDAASEAGHARRAARIPARTGRALQCEPRTRVPVGIARDRNDASRGPGRPLGRAARSSNDIAPCPEAAAPRGSARSARPRVGTARLCFGSTPTDRCRTSLRVDAPAHGRRRLGMPRQGQACRHTGRSCRCRAKAGRVFLAEESDAGQEPGAARRPSDGFPRP